MEAAVPAQFEEEFALALSWSLQSLSSATRRLSCSVGKYSCLDGQLRICFDYDDTQIRPPQRFSQEQQNKLVLELRVHLRVAGEVEGPFARRERTAASTDYGQAEVSSVPRKVEQTLKRCSRHHLAAIQSETPSPKYHQGSEQRV